MEIYDIIMLAILVGAVVFGALKGMAWQIATIAALVVSYFVAIRFSEPVSQFIKVDAPLNKLAAMLLLYLATSLVIWIGFGFVRRSIEKMALKDFDRHAGAILGAISGVLMCVTVTLFSVTLLEDGQRQYVTRSKSGMHITRWINEYQRLFPPAVNEVLAPYIQRLNEEMGYNNLAPPKSADPPPRPGV
ncbi:MAG: CvpA family protein [Planctomycetaceae bacterium]|nr:CvpA family protein [Planctomycetaceae bacterium]